LLLCINTSQIEIWRKREKEVVADIFPRSSLARFLARFDHQCKFSCFCFPSLFFSPFYFLVFVKELRHLVVERASEWMDTFIRAAHYSSSSLSQSSDAQSGHKTLVLAQQLFGKIKESWRFVLSFVD
jgi:hypothetical protein